MNVVAEIFDLLDAEGQSAPDMTQALKSIGDGDMKLGIKKIAEYFHDQGCKERSLMDESKGMAKATAILFGLGVLAKGGIYLYKKYREKNALQEQDNAGQEIVDALKAAVPDAENNGPSIQTQSEIEQGEAPAENTAY